MSTKQKARRAPGKDYESKESLAHCAACGSPIAEGDRVAYCLMPVGVSFHGGLISEKLAVCSDCSTLARSSADGADKVNSQIVDRYLGDATDVAGILEPDVSKPDGWLH
jgi:hypothetical protein